MRHICVLLHGIKVRSQERVWNEELAVRAYPHAQGRIEFLPRKYGYVSGLGVWAFWSYRDYIVDHEEHYFNELRKDVGPDCKISVICHSLGGYIIHKLLQRGLKFHRVIELYGAGDENEDWYAIENNFDRFYVWWSKFDEVIPLSYFGQIGLKGPQKAHPRVFSIETGGLHEHFMEDYEMYALLKTWIDELEAE